MCLLHKREDNCKRIKEFLILSLKKERKKTQWKHFHLEKTRLKLLVPEKRHSQDLKKLDIGLLI